MKPDVLVIGAGPVGLTMAAELARYGVGVRIVDKAAQRSDKSKALVLWSRTLELIDRMGCGASFVEAGRKVREAEIISGGATIARVNFDGLKTPHPYGLMLPQSETERLMEHHLNSLGVEVERPVELIRFVADEDAVTAFLRRPDGGEETVDVDWMIGCDGAHSVVRHGLGMEFEGDTMPSHFILADLHLTGGLPMDEIKTYWHEAGVLVIFPISPGRYRVIADVGEPKAGGHTPDPTLEEVQLLLDQRGPAGIRASDPVWLSGFTINERKVADYRAGRVFLAGDAAHVHSPAGGQGMNTGMQDAINLAWKLALVCRGSASPEPLLGSYSAERSEVGREVLANAGRLTTIALVRGAIAQSIRNHLASMLFGFSPVKRAVTNQMSDQCGGARPFRTGRGRAGADQLRGPSRWVGRSAAVHAVRGRGWGQRGPDRPARRCSGGRDPSAVRRRRHMAGAARRLCGDDRPARGMGPSRRLSRLDRLRLKLAPKSHALTED